MRRMMMGGTGLALLLLLAVPVSSGVLWVERRHISWRVIRWALPSRIPGTVLGVWLATAFDARVLGIVVAVMVLVRSDRSKGWVSEVASGTKRSGWAPSRT